MKRNAGQDDHNLKLFCFVGLMLVTEDVDCQKKMSFCRQKLSPSMVQQ